MMMGLRAKRLDAIWFSGELAPSVIEGYGAYIDTSREVMSGRPCCVLLVSGRLISERPDPVKKMVGIDVEYAMSYPDYRFFEWYMPRKLSEDKIFDYFHDKMEQASKAK